MRLETTKGGMVHACVAVRDDGVNNAARAKARGSVLRGRATSTTNAEGDCGYVVGVPSLDGQSVAPLVQGPHGLRQRPSP